MLMSRSLLIVGCGYLGERLLRQAVDQGWQVAATCRSVQRRAYLEQLGASAVFCEVTHPHELASLPAADVVVYAVSLNLRNSQDVSCAWLVGLGYLLERWQTRPRAWRRFILLSSTSVYGQKDEKLVSESDAEEPESPAGRITLRGESLARQSARGAGDLVIARLSGIYGPGRIVYARHFRQQLPLNADPNGWLNLIHVEDAARAILALADTHCPDLVYNITDDEPVRRMAYWQALSQWLALPVPPIIAPSIESGAKRRISNAKLKCDLGLEWLYPTFRTGVPHSLQEESAVALGCERSSE